MAISIDIRISVNADDIDMAYYTLNREMNKIVRKGFSWASLDTWFDNNGDQIPMDTINKLFKDLVDAKTTDDDIAVGNE